MSNEIQTPQTPIFERSVQKPVLYDFEAGNIPDAGVTHNIVGGLPRPQEVRDSLASEDQNLPEGVTPISRGLEIRDARVVAAQTAPKTQFDITSQPEVPATDEANRNGQPRLDVGEPKNWLGRLVNKASSVIVGDDRPVGTRAHRYSNTKDEAAHKARMNRMFGGPVDPNKYKEF